MSEQLVIAFLMSTASAFWMYLAQIGSNLFWKFFNLGLALFSFIGSFQYWLRYWRMT